jgi:hypothetical protein
MGDTAQSTVELEELVNAAIATPLEKIRKGLGKEGADVDIEIDAENRKIVVTLVRNRIVCEGCLLPADLVATMLRNALRTDAAVKNFTIETLNWADLGK